MQFRPGDARPARLEECIGLGEDETEDEEDAKDIGDKQPQNDGIRRRDRRVAGKNQKTDEPDEEGKDNGHGTEPGRKPGMVIFSAQSPPRYFLITHGRRQKDMEGSGTVRDKKQGESRCHNITLLQDCDISGAG